MARVEEGLSFRGGGSSVGGGGEPSLCAESSATAGTGAPLAPISQLGTELPRGAASWPGWRRVCSRLGADLFLEMPFSREKPAALG